MEIPLEVRTVPEKNVGVTGWNGFGSPLPIIEIRYADPLPQIEIGYADLPKSKLSAYPLPPNLNYFTLTHLDCLNVQLTAPPFLVHNECDILFMMYFVIASNANKMRIHTDQLIMSKRTCIVYL